MLIVVSSTYGLRLLASQLSTFIGQILQLNRIPYLTHCLVQPIILWAVKVWFFICCNNCVFCFCFGTLRFDWQTKEENKTTKSRRDNSLNNQNQKQPFITKEEETKQKLASQPDTCPRHRMRTPNALQHLTSWLARSRRGRVQLEYEFSPSSQDYHLFLTSLS